MTDKNDELEEDIKYCDKHLIGYTRQWRKPMTDETMPIYSQGRFLNLPAYKNRSQEWKKAAHEQEQKLVFKNFTALDGGKSREFVCQCNDAETAAVIAKALNNHTTHQKVLDALEVARKSLYKIAFMAGDSLDLPSDRERAEKTLAQINQILGDEERPDVEDLMCDAVEELHKIHPPHHDPDAPANVWNPRGKVKKRDD